MFDQRWPNDYSAVLQLFRNWFFDNFNDVRAGLTWSSVSSDFARISLIPKQMTIIECVWSKGFINKKIGYVNLHSGVYRFTDAKLNY